MPKLQGKPAKAEKSERYVALMYRLEWPDNNTDLHKPFFTFLFTIKMKFKLQRKTCVYNSVAAYDYIFST